MPTLNPTADGAIGARTTLYSTLLLSPSGKNLFDSVEQGDGLTDTGVQSSIHSAAVSTGGFNLRQTYMEFDTSTISSATSAQLKIFITEKTSAFDIIVCKGTFSGTPSTSFFNDFTRLVTYSSATTLGSASAYMTITLNASALIDIVNNSSFKLMIVDVDHCFNEETPDADVNNAVNIRYRDTSTDTKPELVIGDAPPSRAGTIKLVGHVQLSEGLISI